MSKDIQVVTYNEAYKNKWDEFVLTNSFNGTFLQTRNFLEYHPQNRFVDNSLMFLLHEEIIAVIPAHIRLENGKIFCSHLGSTFGGVLVGKKFLKVKYLDSIFENLEKYFVENKYTEVLLKQTGNIYQHQSSEIVDYYFSLNDYVSNCEMGYYIDFDDYNDNIESNFLKSARRDYRYSLRNPFLFRKMTSREEIILFYEVLLDNYAKFNKMPVHTLEELVDLKLNRLPKNIDFYGVFFESELVAASMVFKFNKDVFHTQYLAAKRNWLDSYVNEFLYANLIETAKKENYAKISFGTCTFDCGKVLNRSLAQFKERFGTKVYVNRIYRKNFKDK